MNQTCGCSGKGGQDISDPKQASTTDINSAAPVQLIHRIGTAFNPAPPSVKAKHFWPVLGEGLITSAAAFDEFANRLDAPVEGLDTSRRRLASQLAKSVNRCSEACRDAGLLILEREAPRLPELNKPAEALAKHMGRVAKHVIKLSYSGEGTAMFGVYAQAFGRIGDQLSRMLATLTPSETTGKVAPAAAFAYFETAQSLQFLSRYVEASLSSGILAVVTLPGITACAAPCPIQGCTFYCTDHYESIISCTPANWQRIFGAIGGPQGLYHITCRWNVRTRKHVVCACYRDRWDSFWAVNACSSSSTVVWTSARAETYNHYTSAWTTPPALPAPFTRGVPFCS
ncbi:hypothetical protein [Motiliproteus sp. SC1-56]|uniref:hypothetical protein n=1 Tax=Motiliproteus sp. SC1-56 TaxID=2799565 RepID=UPI001A8FA39F|nr:hypothetical protein [Motiliproteus sp. SC1-56]